MRAPFAIAVAIPAAHSTVLRPWAGAGTYQPPPEEPTGGLTDEGSSGLTDEGAIPLVDET